MKVAAPAGGAPTISLDAARQALEALRDAGLVKSLRGSGTYVRAETSPMPVVPLIRPVSALTLSPAGNHSSSPSRRVARSRPSMNSCSAYLLDGILKAQDH